MNADTPRDRVKRAPRSSIAFGCWVSANCPNHRVLFCFLEPWSSPPHRTHTPKATVNAAAVQAIRHERGEGLQTACWHSLGRGARAELCTERRTGRAAGRADAHCTKEDHEREGEAGKQGPHESRVRCLHFLVPKHPEQAGEDDLCALALGHDHGVAAQLDRLLPCPCARGCAGRKAHGGVSSRYSNRLLTLCRALAGDTGVPCAVLRPVRVVGRAGSSRNRAGGSARVV
jgi:hypothetical protein